MNETQPREIQLMQPHTLADFELKAVGKIAAERVDKFPVFCPWLVGIIAVEIARREFGLEPAGFLLPEWSYSEIADVLAGTWTFTQFPVTTPIGEFFDDLHKIVVNASVAMLELKGC